MAIVLAFLLFLPLGTFPLQDKLPWDPSHLTGVEREYLLGAAFVFSGKLEKTEYRVCTHEGEVCTIFSFSHVQDVKNTLSETEIWQEYLQTGFLEVKILGLPKGQKLTSAPLISKYLSKPIEPISVFKNDSTDSYLVIGHIPNIPSLRLESEYPIIKGEVCFTNSRVLVKDIRDYFISGLVTSLKRSNSSSR